MVAQAVGAGLVRFGAGQADVLVDVLRTLRAPLERRGGSLTILRCLPPVKSDMDVWGDAGDVLSLMRNIKAQFDPLGILNPGRFVAGI